MFSSVRRLWLALLAVAALCLAAPLSASAATTRYASPDGTGASPCPQTAPCSLETALSEADGLSLFDTVRLAPGTYHPAGELKVNPGFVTVEGEPGQPAPLIEAAGERGLFFQNTGTARDLRIHATMATFYGLTMIGSDSVIERVAVTGESFFACAVAAVEMRDTLCAAEPSLGGGEGVTMFVAGTAPETYEASLYNVTAIGGRTGIFAGANDHSTVIVNATNTIATGGEADVIAESDVATAPAAVNLSHSNFAEVETEGAEAHVTAPTANANQATPPLFVDEAAGDYREGATSPTRLAGDLAVILPGETDLLESPRTTDCEGTVGVDIGAYQYECPAPESPPVVPAEEKKSVPPPIAAPGPGISTETRPSLSRLALKPAKFAVTGEAPKGTTVSFTLSAAAAVKLEVLGKKTVKGKKKTVTLGSLTQVTGKSGANSVKFSGKLKGKPLEPGRYTLRATATAGGLSSAPATVSFEVRIP